MKQCHKDNLQKIKTLLETNIKVLQKCNKAKYKKCRQQEQNSRKQKSFVHWHTIIFLTPKTRLVMFNNKITRCLSELNSSKLLNYLDRTSKKRFVPKTILTDLYT